MIEVGGGGMSLVIDIYLCIIYTMLHCIISCSITHDSIYTLIRKKIYTKNTKGIVLNTKYYLKSQKA